MAYYFPVKGIWKLIKIAIEKIDTPEIISRIRLILKYPLWQMSGIFGLLMVSLMIFIDNII